MRNGKGDRGDAAAGFTLPVMLVVMIGVSGVAASADISNRYRQAREREVELIFRGLAYVRAIKSFYLAEKDPKLRRLPRDLGEIENDPRSAYRRHIRELYKDPLTGGEFRILQESGGVTGVASSSRDKLFRRTRLSDQIPFAAGAERYDQVLFEVDIKQLEPNVSTRPPVRKRPVN